MESKQPTASKGRASGRVQTGRAAVKTTLNLSAEAIDAMRELALARNTTLAEVIRRAIALDKYLHETTREGGKILVEDADKTLKQLVFF